MEIFLVLCGDALGFHCELKLCYKFLKVGRFYNEFENLLAFGAPSPNFQLLPPDFKILLFPRPSTKAASFPRKFGLFEIFSLIFHILLFYANFRKVTPNFWGSPNNKILSRLRKTQPPNIWWTPLTENSCIHY